MVNPLRLAAAAWRGAVAEYRRQRNPFAAYVIPPPGWFGYARIGAGVSTDDD